MATLFALLFLASLPLLLWGLVSPSHFSKVARIKVPNRKRAGLIFGGLSVLFFVLAGITAPTIVTKQVVETKAIPFETTTQKDPTLPVLQFKTIQEGKTGVETDTYSVTVTNGRETARSLLSKATTTSAVNKVVAEGTLLPHIPPSCDADSYVNSDGICVQRPIGDPLPPPPPPTAQCNDGTFSFSQHRQGTCSHHGGVMVWY